MSLSAEDSLAILRLIADADDCASARDVQGYVELFTEDGGIRGAAGTATGQAELAVAVAALWFEEPIGTLHLTLNPTIEETDDEPAVHSVSLIMVANGIPRLIAAARVRTAIRWTPVGWRIALRETFGNAG